MALEPITRQEKIIAGQDLTPITRMEKFLKQYGGGSGGVTSWNDLADKPFGDNADGSVTKLSGKYVEGMGYEEDGVVHPIDQKLLGTISGKHVEGMGYVDKEWASWSEKETLETYNSNDFGQVYAYLHVGEGKILEFGKTYRVSVNGETYVCVAEENKMAEPKYAMLYCKNSSGEVVYEIDDVNQDGAMTFIASGREKREVAIDISATFLEESTAEAYTHPTFGQAWLINSALKLTVGETYTVVYNGTEYKCVCGSAPAGFSSDPDAVAMGNFSAAGGADTGEPFAMLISNAQNRVDIIDLSDANSVKVKIYKGTIHPIDPKLLPSGGGAVIFTMTDTGYTCNVTYAEADEMLRNGASAFIQMFRNTLELVVSGQRLTAIKVEWYLGVSVPYMKLYFEPAPNVTMSLTYKEDNTITEEE